MNSEVRRAIFLASFAHFVIEICSGFLPVAYPIFIATLHLTYAQVGVVALVLGVGASLTQPIFGYLSDRWGPQRITVVSVVWIGLLMGLVGWASGYWLLVLVVALGSLGSAAFHPAGATIASTGDGRRRGAAVAFFSVGGNLGAALSPLLVAAAIGWLGVRGTSVVFPIALLCALLLSQQLGRGLRPESGPPAADQPRRAQPNGRLVGLLLIVFGIMFRSWFQVTLMTYLPVWIQTQGGSLAAGGRMLFVFVASVALGSLGGGALSDRIGRWQVMALGLGLLGPAYWLFQAAASPLQVAMLVAMGVLIGFTFPVSIVMAQEAWPRGVGLASALVMGLGWAPGGIGASITGLLADRYSLAVGLQSLVVVPVLGLACIVAYVALERRKQPVSMHIQQT